MEKHLAARGLPLVSPQTALTPRGHSLTKVKLTRPVLDSSFSLYFLFTLFKDMADIN